MTSELAGKLSKVSTKSKALTSKCDTLSRELLDLIGDADILLKKKNAQRVTVDPSDYGDVGGHGAGSGFDIADAGDADAIGESGHGADGEAMSPKRNNRTKEAARGEGGSARKSNKRNITDAMLDAAIAEVDDGYDAAFAMEFQRLKDMGLNF